MNLATVHGIDSMLAVEVDNVPPFSIDLGAATNQWHRERNQSPSVEPFETQIFVKLLTDSPKVLDIGANMGWYSCVASAVTNGRAEVYAFEPEPNNFTLMSRNCALNFFHNVNVKHMGLGSEDTTGKLFLNPDNIGDHRTTSVEGRSSIDIAICKLDSVLANTGFEPDLLKIDVQGAEPHVFKGAEKTLAKAGGGLAICMEFFPAGMGTEAAHGLVDLIFSWDRPIMVIHPYEGGLLLPLAREKLHEAVDGCLQPSLDKHMDLLITPLDGRMDGLQSIVGRNWEQWAY